MDALFAPSALDKAIAEYNENGAAVLRGVLSPEWVARGQAAIDAILLEQFSGQGGDLNAPDSPRFFNGLFTWLSNSEIKALIFESGLAEIAAQVMGASEVRFFYDQMLVKEPGAGNPTPWHQDLSYWPATGEQIMSIWIPFDRATPETGVVTYVKGSHRWNEMYRATAWSDPKNPNAAFEKAAMAGAQPELPTLPDIKAHPDKYEFITWDLEPGDVILHHPLAIHGAPGNASRTVRRRALSLRWLGDDARWDDSHAHFLRLQRAREMLPLGVQVQGEAFHGELFPVVWPTPAPNM
jgi:ectoine hydroxylase-related dioxygenase (phytanoyl-CoA dioxygenase family)